MSPLQELAVSEAARDSGRISSERPVDSAAMAAMSRMRDNLRVGLRRSSAATGTRPSMRSLPPRLRGALSTEDLERLAEAAWWIGKSEECIKLRERVYTLYLASGDSLRAAAVAIAVAEDYFHKLARSVAHGWLQRAERHLRGLARIQSSTDGWRGAKPCSRLAKRETRARVGARRNGARDRPATGRSRSANAGAAGLRTHARVAGPRDRGNGSDR